MFRPLLHAVYGALVNTIFIGLERGTDDACDYRPVPTASSTRERLCGFRLDAHSHAGC